MHADRVSVAQTGSLIADNSHRALGGDLDDVRPQTGCHLPIDNLDFRSVDGQHDDAVVTLAGYIGAFAIEREDDVARA